MADVVKVIPPALLEASTRAAMHVETAAAVHPGLVPVTSPGSPADAAAAALAAGMSARSAELSAKLAGKGPEIQELTQSAVAQLQGTDQQSATQIEQLGQGVSPPQTPPHGGIQPAGFGIPRPLDPPPLPPPVDPFPGWTDQQKEQVAVEIANGHAREDHFPGVSEPDLARRIYNALKDPKSVGTSDDGEGLVVLGKDGTIVLVKPNDPDYGTAFAPQPLPGMDWKNPEDYFDKHSRPLLPLPPPTPGRLPPVGPGEISPAISAPPSLPSIGQHPAPSPLPPTVLDHPPVTVPPPVAQHPPLPPWLQDPSPPGYQVTPSQPPDIFNWDQPDPLPPAPPPAPAPVPAPGPGLIPHIDIPHIDIPPPTSVEGILIGGGLLALLIICAPVGA